MSDDLFGLAGAAFAGAAAFAFVETSGRLIFRRIDRRRAAQARADSVRMRAAALAELASRPERCTVPPIVWWCSRPGGHEGYCASHPYTTEGP